ncbi:hypothetical protein F2Q69_00017013 [Brassica cretica]|uniref:Uncharacterized protein n=1 Tax=Brassica cretica TaxID=69181 RepID=A0A8S9R033_BRACR|nr:hypothetical protein F2Q69_00017013 [Brassica cretica]
MGKYLVKLGNVDFLDSQQLRQTSPPGRWALTAASCSLRLRPLRQVDIGLGVGCFPSGFSKPLHKASPILSLRS